MKPTLERIAEALERIAAALEQQAAPPEDDGAETVVTQDGQTVRFEPPKVPDFMR